MASSRVYSVIRGLELIQKDIKTGLFHGLRREVEILKLNLQFLKTFLICARKWISSDVCLEYDDGKKVSLQSFLSGIEVFLNNHGKDTHSVSLSPQKSFVDLRDLDKELKTVVTNFRESIKSFKQEIIEVYGKLPGFSLSQSNSDDELVWFMDSVLQNLVDLLSGQYFEYMEDYDTVLHSQLEALEDKLTFLKNFIRFAKLCGVKRGQLEDLLAHTNVVALYAARLSYTCLFYEEDEEVRNPKMCSLISEVLQKIKPIDVRVCEIYSKVLKASKSSLSSHTKKLDKHIVRDFNDSLISSLWELLCCNTSFLVSVKGQMQILYEGLRFLRSILRERHEKMDELNQKILAVIGEAGIVICSLFVKEGDADSTVVRSSPDLCAMLDGTNNKIEHIKSQIGGSSVIASIRSHPTSKGQEVRKISRPSPSGGTTPITHEVVVGFDDEAERLIKRLVQGSDRLAIIPIVGMPGLGKTTLAKKVYSDSYSHFHIRLWCSVSQIYDMKSLLLQILCSDGKHSGVYEDLKVLDEHDLLKKLYQKLKENRYLVVFDDVRDIKVWNELRSAFPDDKNRSRILFTSQFSNVLSEVEYGEEPHYIRLLTDGKSWELLQKKVFGNEDCPQALHEIGMEIAKQCKGLPLTVVVIAGILATLAYEGWVEVSESLISTTVSHTDQCKKTLELSYVYLPQYLKPCLLYFGAFREYQEIQSKKLMWLWIAEGFVQNTDPKILEVLAEQYIEDLVGRNLVMVAKHRSIGGVKACLIHDLIHEFCKAKAKEENFLQVLHGYDDLSAFNEPPNLDRLSIWSKFEHFKKSRLFCPRVSSLLLYNRIEESDDSESLMADISFVFCIFKGLRVLDLEQILLRHKVFPSEVESLVELRYLGVQGEMRVIPPSIANLSNLETFRVMSYYGTVSLPTSVWNMAKLRHLHIEGYDVCFSLPSENLENNAGVLNLDTFSTLTVSLDQRVESILEKIPNVRQLKIQLSGAKESTTTGYCNMSGLERLKSLEVWAKSLPPDHVEFSFPSTLKKLVLGGLSLSWEKIQMIERLENLEVLKLLSDSFAGDRWVLTKKGFPKLRFLGLEYLDVVDWTDEDEESDDEDEESDDHFPCLEKLFLSGISKLQMVPSCLKFSSTLEVIEVRHCEDSVKELVWEIEQAQKDFAGKHLRIIN